MDIRLQEEPAEGSQPRPGGLTSPGVCEEHGTGRQCGCSGLRTGGEVGLGTAGQGQVVLVDLGKD